MNVPIQREPYRVDRDPANLDMPRTIKQLAQQRQLPGAYEQNSEYQEPQQPWSVRAFDFMWPTTCWCLVVYNLALMFITTLSMALSKEGYNAWTHAQAAGISVTVLAVMAISYKWILMGDDGLPKKAPKPEKPHTTPPIP